jgi:acyl-CoA synthetase (AMP-forming)/AMP-acid ligase II
LGELTTPELLEQARRDSANKPFLVGNGARFTFEQTYEEVVRIAAGLEVLGVTRGSRILIVLNTRVEYSLLLFAAHSLGALCINVNPAYSRDETAFICEDCNPTLVISEMDLLGDVEAACAGRKLLILGLDRSRGDALAWSTLPTGNRAQPLKRTGVTPDDAATVIYTSGTTSRPKGVMLRQGSHGFAGEYSESGNMSAVKSVARCL